MRQHTTSSSSALDGIKQSTMQIGNRLGRSLDNLAQAMREPHPPHQHVYYGRSVHGSSFGNGVSYIPVVYQSPGTLLSENVDTRRAIYHSL